MYLVIHPKLHSPSRYSSICPSATGSVFWTRHKQGHLEYWALSFDKNQSYNFMHTDLLCDGEANKLWEVSSCRSTYKYLIFIIYNTISKVYVVQETFIILNISKKEIFCVTNKIWLLRIYTWTQTPELRIHG